MSADISSGVKTWNMSADRAFFTKHELVAQKVLLPSTVLEVGFPLGLEKSLEMWFCKVETVDPNIDVATHNMRFEDLDGREFDLINLTSVIDAVDNPVAVISKASTMAKAILIQGKLCTYKSEFCSIGLWAPTKLCVSQLMPRLVPLFTMAWCEFREDSVFSTLFVRKDTQA